MAKSSAPENMQPEELRAAMTRTRTALSRKLKALRDRLLGATGTAEGVRTMREKKSKAMNRRKKTAENRLHTRRKGSAFGSKARAMLSDVLVGAAAGAVKGAAEAAAADADKLAPQR